MSVLVKKQRSIHRHLQPCFDKKSKNPIAKMLMCHIEKHDFQRNAFINKARYAGGVVNLGFSQFNLNPRRNRMRIEREQTLRETLKALVYNANYKANSNSLFEVKMSVKALAKHINQLHTSDATEKYRHGRQNYNPVLNALKDLAAAGLVMLQQNYSVKLKRYQSMRIFITPELFSSLGVRKKTVKKLIHSQHKHDLKNGYDANKQNREEHLRSLANESIQENESHSLKSFKNRIKNEFNIPEDLQKVKKKLKNLIKSTKTPSATEGETSSGDNAPLTRFNRLVVEKNIPMFTVYDLKERLNQEYPTLNKGSPPYYNKLIELLKANYQ